jgi:O-antigen/teichoic acid export membrane protein
MKLVYGPKYAGAGILLGFLSSANAFRSLRVAPGLAALAKGDSQNQMIASSGRMLALAPAAVLAMTHQPLWCVACCGLLGESLACWISIVRLRRRDGIPLSSSLIPAAWVLFAVGCAGAMVLLGAHRLPPGPGLSVAVLGSCIGVSFLIVRNPELRTEVWRLYTQGIRR